MEFRRVKALRFLRLKGKENCAAPVLEEVQKHGADVRHDLKGSIGSSLKGVWGGSSLADFASAQIGLTVSTLINNFTALLLDTIENFDLEQFIRSLIASVQLKNWVNVDGARFKSRCAWHQSRLKRAGRLAPALGMVTSVSEYILEAADQHFEVLKIALTGVVVLSLASAFVLGVLLDWDFSW